MSTRFDAWTEEHDRLLAETVLRHVREGSTQLNAFEEAGDQMNRTAAACAYRWNAVVRLPYADQLAQAKRERRLQQRHKSSVGINELLMRELMVYAMQKGRPPHEVAEEAIKDYLAVTRQQEVERHASGSR